ncbi:hypothetical protein CMK22_00665 [Candidatus Poribacteria bacterium]|nr:hypothetical protein [Candidatus Poribacteria bacterium]
MLFSGTVLQPPILENLMKIVVIDTETIRWSDEVPGRWDNVENFGLSILVLGIPNNGSLEFQVCSPNYADHLSRLQLQFSDRETIEKVLNEAERIVSFNADNFDFRILESVQFDVQQWREKSFDILTEFTRKVGHRINLENLAKTQFGSSKTFITAKQAVEFWRAGLELMRGWSGKNDYKKSSDTFCYNVAKHLFQEVVEYCKQDVRLTYELYQHILQNQSLNYTDRRSNIKKVKLIV